MTVEYIAPLERALSRMKRALFTPFDLETWLVLGFAAFLAGLTQVLGSGSNGIRLAIDHGRPEVLGERAAHAWALLAEPIWLLVGIAVLVLVIALALLFTWISSRGKFVFLDDLVRQRVAIADPWKRFGHLGDSLFLWRVGFGLVLFFLVLLIVLPIVVAMVASGVAKAGALVVGLLVILLGSVLVLAIAAVFIQVCVESFVVPIMYRDDLTVLKAWKRFLPLLREHFWWFVLYALFLLALVIGVGLATVVLGCATCCCLFLLLVIPYVGSVVSLPVSFTLRGFGPEFLAQFGPQWSVFEPPPAAEAPALDGIPGAPV